MFSVSSLVGFLHQVKFVISTHKQWTISVEGKWIDENVFCFCLCLHQQ